MRKHAMANEIVADIEGSGIYQIRNLINGKRYIGSAKSFKVRWGKHLSDLKLSKHHSVYLQRSWNTHGAESFEFKILEVCSLDSLVDREQSWLDEAKPEYNICMVAGNCLGVKQSDETKEKRAAKLRGRKYPEAAAKRVGQKRTPEQCARFSEAQRRFIDSLSDEQRLHRKEKIAASNREKITGRKQSQEEKDKRAKSLMGHVVSEETRRKISEANKGRKPSPLALANRKRYLENKANKCPA
jgi:group I intron endonuclease